MILRNECACGAVFRVTAQFCEQWTCECFNDNFADVLVNKHAATLLMFSNALGTDAYHRQELWLDKMNTHAAVSVIVVTYSTATLCSVCLVFGFFIFVFWFLKVAGWRSDATWFSPLQIRIFKSNEWRVTSNVRYASVSLQISIHDAWWIIWATGASGLYLICVEYCRRVWKSKLETLLVCFSYEGHSKALCTNSPTSLLAGHAIFGSPRCSFLWTEEIFSKTHTISVKWSYTQYHAMHQLVNMILYLGLTMKKQSKFPDLKTTKNRN